MSTTSFNYRDEELYPEYWDEDEDEGAVFDCE